MACFRPVAFRDAVPAGAGGGRLAAVLSHLEGAREGRPGEEHEQRQHRARNITGLSVSFKVDSPTRVV